MNDIKTQNVTLETLNLSTEKKQPTATSSEEFTAALEAVTQKETTATKTEVKEQVEESGETTIDSEEQNMSWSLWMKQPMLFEPPVNLEQAESTTEIDGMAEVARIETIDTNSTMTILQANPTDDTLLSDIVELNPLEPTEFQKNTEIESTLQFSIDDVMATETIDDEMVQRPLSVKTPEMLGEQLPVDINEDVRKLVEPVNTQSDLALIQEVGFKETLELPVESKGISEKLVDLIEVTPSTTEGIEAVEKSEFLLIEEIDIDSELEVENAKPDHSLSELSQTMADIRGLQTSKEIVLPAETVKVAESDLVQKMEVLVVEQLESTGELDNVSTTRIQLTPDHLGEMDIEITLKNNELTAKLVVEYAETKEWLEQKVAELTTKLAVQEIQVQEFEIIIAQNKQPFMDLSFEESPFFKQQEESKKQMKSLTDKVVIENEVEVNTSNRNDAGAGRLSIWV